MHEQRKWYLEADTALGEGAMKTGDMTAKGNFRSLRMLDELFDF